MIVAVPSETYPGERRVALIPAAVATLVKSGLEVHIEAGAGQHFDPELVEIFFACLNVLRSIQKRYQDII